jgi:sugar phosphate isomerase/epimerase
MGNIIGTGFNAGSTDGELANLEQELRILADTGVDTVELGLTSLDLIAGGRIIEERAERLVALTRQFDFRYTVHGLVSSNFMDPDTCRYQLDAAKALAVQSRGADRLQPRLYRIHLSRPEFPQ